MYKRQGYIYGVSPGTAVITATSGSQSKTCTVTVTAAEPVRTAYASPNIAGVGSAVTFTAITDTTRDGVRFTVQFPSGTTQMISATSSTTETTGQTSTKVWKAAMNLTEQGTYRVTVSSSQGGVYSAESFETSAYVVSSQDYTVTTSEQRRASDKMIELIANWEGYSCLLYTSRRRRWPLHPPGCRRNWAVADRRRRPYRRAWRAGRPEDVYKRQMLLWLSR